MTSELTRCINELSARMDGTAKQQTFADDPSSPPEFFQRLYDVQHKLMTGVKTTTLCLYSMYCYIRSITEQFPSEISTLACNETRRLEQC